MQKKTDMGKAHWLSQPTLVGESLLSTAGITGRQNRGSSESTFSRDPPQTSQLSTPWGR